MRLCGANGSLFNLLAIGVLVLSVFTFQQKCATGEPRALDASTDHGLQRRTSHNVRNDDLRSWCLFQDISESNAQQRIAERAGWFQAELPHERNIFRSAPAESYHSGYMVSPYFPCFFNLTKSLSVRKHFDGGKWLCGVDAFSQRPSNAQKKCVVYSFGSNYDTTFEDEINKATAGACEIHVYDPTMTSSALGHSERKLDAFLARLPSNFNFHKYGLSASGSQVLLENGKDAFPTVSLAEALAENNHLTGGIDILKFDIEGFEYEMIESTPWSQIKVGLILFEMHSKKIEKLLRRPFTLLLLHQLVQHLENAGYRLYSTEPVCGGCLGHSELAFVHKDWHPIHGFNWTC